MNRKERRAESARKRKQKGRVLSLGEALNLAMQLHQGGRLEKAESLYRQIISASEEQPDAHHFLGVLCHQTGRSDEAIGLISRAIVLNPDYPDAHNNLGNVYKELGKFAEAASAYQACLELDPQNANALNNIGIVLKEQDRFEEAVASYQRAIEIDPQHADAYYNLGNALRKLDRIEEAITAYQKSITLARPDQVDAYKSLGRMLLIEKRHEEAVAVFKQWLDFDPDSPVARHMYAACSGVEIPDRASDDYVAETFDSFAGSFDTVLKRLEYRAPELVLTAVRKQLGEPRPDVAILDAGCGTGLCGPLLRPYAKLLAGVDLSQGMVNKASGRDVYDELHVDELTRFFADRPQAYDLIVSADTFCYFGDLTQVCKTAHGALGSGGHLIFTLEKIVEPAKDERFRLNPHGRYSHSRDYIENTLQSAGLACVSLVNDFLRKEAGEPVAGMVVVARKT